MGGVTSVGAQDGDKPGARQWLIGQAACGIDATLT
jgi:hypothetical protein